jgi:predicted DsbA family dithiol-disulfide isomerase
MTATATLHVWHDYVCPFSYVAATRIMRLKEAAKLNFDVRFRPWPLEAANGTQPVAEDEDQWVRQLRAIEPEAFAQWNPSSGYWPASSQLLFAAYEAAPAHDSAAAARFDLLLRQAIFRHPRPVDSTEALSDLAGDAGLDVAAFRRSLQDGSAERQAQAAGAEAPNLGIRGIPTLVLPDGEKVINPGLEIRRTAQGRVVQDDLAALRELLRRAAGGARAGASHG